MRFHGEAIVTGRGSIEYLRKIECSRAFVVTGGGSMFRNGTIDKIKAIMSDKGSEVYVYPGIRQNPSTDAVLESISYMREFQPDTVIAVGGGSAIDAAKAMALFYEYPDMDFEKARKGEMPVKRGKVKFVAIPSTSGTASEVTPTSVITYNGLDIKLGLKTPAFLPDIAILDADLTMTMPQNVVAETGMDAVTHAVECYISRALNDFTECLASGAVEGLFKYLPLSYKNGDIESREKVHNYQSIAGCAFANAGLGAAHGISHAIGAHYDEGHGLINAVALPYVLQFNSRDEIVNERLSYLARRIGKENFIDAVKELNETLNIPKSFKDMGIPEEGFKDDFELLVDNCMKNSTQRNPVPVSREDMVKLLNCIYYGKGVE